MSIKSATYHRQNEQADGREDYMGNGEPGEEVVSMLRGGPGHEPAHSHPHDSQCSPGLGGL